MWHCMKMPGVDERYTKLEQDMHRDVVTLVRNSAGMTEEFEEKVGLH